MSQPSTESLPKPGEPGYDPVLHGDGTIPSLGILKGPNLLEPNPAAKFFGVDMGRESIVMQAFYDPLDEPKPAHPLNWKQTRVEKLHPIEAYGLPYHPTAVPLESSKVDQSLKMGDFMRMRRSIHAKFQPDEVRQETESLLQQMQGREIPLPPAIGLPSSAS